MPNADSDFDKLELLFFRKVQCYHCYGSNFLLGILYMTRLCQQNRAETEGAGITLLGDVRKNEQTGLEGVLYVVSWHLSALLADLYM